MLVRTKFNLEKKKGYKVKKKKNTKVTQAILV